jgi:ribosomal protein S18 acetylase RimI-like enzyme
MPVPDYLINPVYAALSTADAPFAESHGKARRFQRDVIPFAGLAEMTAAAMADLVALLMPEEEIHLTVDGGESLVPAAGLSVISTLSGFQMRHRGDLPPEEDDGGLVPLTRDDTEEMLELKAVAFPGFFGSRAPELGQFFGIRDPRSGKLVAMGGERLATNAEREISAVCTHPDHAGQGYAARLVRRLLRYQAGLGVGSILHVTAANERAISLYKRLGFEITGSLDIVKIRRV